MRTAIASAYFASDDVIFAVRDTEVPTDIRVDRVPVSEGVPEPDRAASDLAKAALGIKTLLNGAELVGVSLICPGPFRTIDKSSEFYGRIGRNADVPHWRSKNAIALFRERLRDNLGQDADRVVIYLYNQGGATAKGEFRLMYQSRLSNARRDGRLGEELKTIGNHLFIVADWSIQAGLIVAGEPFHGLSTLNVGHHSVVPAPGDTFAMAGDLSCNVHPRRPCLNSLASLEAIKHRWPKMKPKVFIETEDVAAVSLIAFYIAQMLADVLLITTPAKIVIGGRIADNIMFLPSLRRHLRYLILDHENPEIYPGYPEMQDLSEFITTQQDRDSGVKGGLYIVDRLIRKSREDNIALLEAYQTGIQPL